MCLLKCVCVCLGIRFCMRFSETLWFEFLCAAKSRLKDLLLQKDNQLCADCGAPDPKWA